jgi:hypothetical protein
MRKSSAIKHYGNIVKLAAALRITHGAVCQWKSIIPEKQAMKLERITGGDLVYNPSLYLPNEMPST